MLNIAKLFVQCKQIYKPIFISGFGIQVLTYYCATGYPTLHFDDEKKYHLDYSTGDYYVRKGLKWVPIGNTGLHYSKVLDGLSSNSKRTLMHPRDSSIYISNCYEQIAFIRKVYLQHWLMRGLPLEFKVYASNTWDSHPVNIQSKNLPLIHNNYKTLAESIRGPQITIHEDSICVQFDISPKYPESVKVMFNFLEKYMKDAYVT